MRFVLFLVIALVMVVALLSLLRNLRTGPAPIPAEARWRPSHRSVEGVTHVEVSLTDTVGQVWEHRELGTLADTDPDYDSRFLELMALARQRAAVLDSERPLEP